MLDFNEELKKFHRITEPDELENTLTTQDMTDLMDLVKSCMQKEGISGYQKDKEI